MSRKKISTTIYVTPEQSDRLRVLHERTKVPVAVYIREGIDLILRQYAHLLPGQLALDGGTASSPRQPSSEGTSSSSPPPYPPPTPAPTPAPSAPGDKPERAVSGTK
jgi:hypothetical protein